MKNKKLEVMQQKLILDTIDNMGHQAAWIIDPVSGFSINDTAKYGVQAHNHIVLDTDESPQGAKHVVNKLLDKHELVTIIHHQFWWDEGGSSVYIFLATKAEYTKVWNKTDIATGSFEKHRVITEFVWETARENPNEWVILCSGPY
ncbi:MAG: hypothetical protein DRJ64_04290 [Thermoprotei archaeon]|nr:MAG: hypothetical protein DRJ64_04290 [Thermoprotei archaeon]